MTSTSVLTPAMRAALRWPEQVTVSEWCDRNIVLGHDDAEPGPYRTGRTPYAREIMDGFGHPWVRQITFIKSTQIGGSRIGLNLLAYAIAQDPGPITWVMPTREDAAEFGENRVAPMVDLSPALRAQVTGDRFDAKKRQIKFKRCRVLFRSARVPKELAQYPARYLFGDEAGKWPAWTQDEAAPFELARERTRTFWNHKVFLNSTPKAPGLIDKEFERGDRRRYWVPCPHCGKFQVLIWKRVKWDPKIDTEAEMRAQRDAHYECEYCSGHILDRHKQVMLERGFWCPEGVDPTEHMIEGRFVLPNDRTPHRSYHIWAGYSPWLSWWEIAAEWLRSHGTPATLQNFVNSWLGEPWIEKVDETTADHLHDCVGSYHRGDVPDGVKVITAGVDVQKRFLVFVVRGWGLGMESWLLDHGRVDDFDQLETALLTKVWPRGLRLHSVFIDTRYRAPEVIDLARKHPATVRPCRGVEFDEPIPFKSHAIERHPRTGAVLAGLKVWHLNVGWFKDLVAQSIRQRGEVGPGAFHVYDGADRTYLDEVSSEHKVTQRSGTTVRERWVKKAGHRQNHFWDVEVYARAIAHLIRADTLRAEASPRRRRPPGRGAEEESLHLFGGGQ
jgi:phage terminase large subunit GpA-like protein